MTNEENNEPIFSYEEIEKQVQGWSDSKLADFLGVSIETVYESPPGAVSIAVDKIFDMEETEMYKILEKYKQQIKNTSK